MLLFIYLFKFLFCFLYSQLFFSCIFCEIAISFFSQKKANYLTNNKKTKNKKNNNSNKKIRNNAHCPWVSFLTPTMKLITNQQICNNHLTTWEATLVSEEKVGEMVNQKNYTLRFNYIFLVKNWVMEYIKKQVIK